MIRERDITDYIKRNDMELIFDENGNIDFDAIKLNNKSRAALIENHLLLKGGDIFKIVEQIEKRQVLSGGDIIKLSELGFPLTKLLSYKLSYLEGRTVSAEEVISKIKDGIITYNMVVECMDIYIEYIYGYCKYPDSYKNFLRHELDMVKYYLGTSQQKLKFKLPLEKHNNKNTKQ